MPEEHHSRALGGGITVEVQVRAQRIMINRMSTGPSENRFTRAGAADRARQDAWLTRRYGGSVWRPVLREVPWAIALAGFGYLTIGLAWAVGVGLVLLAVPVGLWWWTNHRVLPARADDGPT